MEPFWYFLGLAAMFVGMGLMIHGIPNIIEINHNYYNSKNEDDETDN